MKVKRALDCFLHESIVEMRAAGLSDAIPLNIVSDVGFIISIFNRLTLTYDDSDYMVLYICVCVLLAKESGNRMSKGGQWEWSYLVILTFFEMQSSEGEGC